MVRVLVVDDSALMRKLISKILNSSPEIEVVGTAIDSYAAREKIKRLNPDVITLDIEMPKMDGISFLEKVMRLHPMPVVMISSLAEKNAPLALKALEIGAVDFVTKPKTDLAHKIEDCAEEIISRVLEAAQAKTRIQVDSSKASRINGRVNGSPRLTNGVAPLRNFKTTDKIIAIGASTGGTVAIMEILQQMPASAPGTVIAQHIPEAFSKHFAARLNGVCKMKVSQALDGEQILPGHVYIAPGNAHLKVIRDGARYLCKLDESAPVNRHRPSIDVLFRSVAQNVGANAVGVILTGMGKDGAEGIKEMRQAGAKTIAQDQATSVVWGMPGEAVNIGGIDSIEPLTLIPTKLMNCIESLSS